MAFHDWGNKPIDSTQTPVSNPSTSTLLAEIDSTQLVPITGGATATSPYGRGGIGRVTAILGASTTADWRVERALSTGLGSTAIQQSIPILTPTGQSGQYVFLMAFEPGDRLRCRLNSTFTGFANAELQVEPLT